MNNFIYTLISFGIVLLIFIFIQNLIKIKLMSKNNDVKIETKIEFVKCNYDGDMKILLDTIDEYTSNITFTELKEYHNSVNIVNDKVFSDLTKKITLDIQRSLSKEYLQLVSKYVSDPQMFIYEKVYYKALTIVMDINKKNIKKLS